MLISFCKLFIYITLTKRRNVVDDSTNVLTNDCIYYELKKGIKKLLMFLFKSRFIIVKSYYVFY
jgi:hypothetical protein